MSHTCHVPQPLPHHQSLRTSAASSPPVKVHGKGSYLRHKKVRQVRSKRNVVQTRVCLGKWWGEGSECMTCTCPRKLMPAKFSLKQLAYMHGWFGHRSRCRNLDKLCVPQARPKSLQPGTSAYYCNSTTLYQAKYLWNPCFSTLVVISSYPNSIGKRSEAAAILSSERSTAAAASDASSVHCSLLNIWRRETGERWAPSCKKSVSQLVVNIEFGGELCDVSTVGETESSAVWPSSDIMYGAI